MRTASKRMTVSASVVPGSLVDFWTSTKHARAVSAPTRHRYSSDMTDPLMNTTRF